MVICTNVMKVKEILQPNYHETSKNEFMLLNIIIINISGIIVFDF